MRRSALCNNPKRVENRSALVTLLEDHFKTKPTRWWSLRLTQAGVPNTRVDRTVNFQALRTDPQVTRNQHIVDMETPHWGTLSVDGLPWKFEKAPAGPIRPGGLQGEQTEEVLREFGIAAETPDRNGRDKRLEG